MTRRWYKNWVWVLALVGLFLTVSSVQAATRPSVQSLERKYNTALTAQKSLDRQRFQLLSKVHKAAAQISKLKTDIKRGGFLGLPARLRLPYARSRAQRLARQMEALEKRLTTQQMQVKRWKKVLSRAYISRLKELAASYKKARQNADKERLKKQLRHWKNRVRQLHPQKKRKGRTLRLILPKINELDGPDELKQKTDALKDLEDRINKRLLKLRRRSRRLNRRIKQSKQDQSLLNDVNDMTQDDSVFDENSRRPRTVQNNRRAQKQNGGGFLSSGSATAKKQTSSSGGTADRGTNNGFNNSGSPSPSPGTKDKGTNEVAPPKVGGSDPTAPSPPPTNTGGTPGVQTPSAVAQPSGQQRLSHLPGNPLSQKLREPSWSGTPEQQMKALQAYKKRLLQQLQQVMKNKRQFQKRATQLKKQEKHRQKK